MRPTRLEPYGSNQNEDQPRLWSPSSRLQSQHGSRRLRSEDSWIDISSQPSSSLFPTQGENQTTSHRSRQLNTFLNLTHLQNPRSNSAAGSSQDEYEESESESDRVLSSSNENISQADDDDDATALAPNVSVFTPQPNAFSHPPSAQTISASNQVANDSYFPPQRPQMNTRLPSNRLPIIRRPSTAPRVSQSNPIPSSDHDAALRASLSTLLSCANAVRKDKEPLRVPTEPSTHQPALQLLTETQLNAQIRPSPQRSANGDSKPRKRSRSSSKSPKSKVSAATKEDLLLCSSIASWCISAGLVLVFSAISFSAGYAWGREVGRSEVQGGISCGQEALRSSRSGLGKLRLVAA